MQLTLGPVQYETQFNFEIPDVDNVGLFLSGGLDSSALLMCIITELEQTNRSHIPINVWTCNKPPDPKNGARMVQKIREEFNREIIYHPNYDVPEQHKAMGIIDLRATKDAYDKFESIQMYLAGNNSYEQTPWKDVPRMQGELKLPWQYPQLPHITYPFLNLLKLHLIDIYYKLEKEHLIKYTYSCSAQEDIACGECFSCLEAATGFEMLGKIRPEYIQHEDIL